MSGKISQLFQAASTDPKLLEKLQATHSIDDFAKVATENGYELTEEEMVEILGHPPIQLPWRWMKRDWQMRNVILFEPDVMRRFKTLPSS